MNQIEEFSNYYLHQSKEDENELYCEYPNEEENNLDEQENNTIKNKEKNIAKEKKLKESTSKRLRSLPKTYQTYTILFKKQVIEEVNPFYNDFSIFQVKANKEEKERDIAKNYGINPKTLHRWVTKGFKKNQGKNI